MGKFSAPLVIEEIGYERWKVVEDFRWTAKSGLVVRVAMGFTTDLASVPQVFRSLVPKIGYWSQAAVVHDLLYRDHRAGINTDITRLQADRALREGAKDKARLYGVSDGQRRDWQIYHFVRAFGVESWETIDEKQTRLENENEDYLD